MKSKLVLIALSLIIVSSCSVVKENGYYQSKRYKTKSISLFNNSKKGLHKNTKEIDKSENYTFEKLQNIVFQNEADKLEVTSVIINDHAVPLLDDSKLSNRKKVEYSNSNIQFTRFSRDKYRILKGTREKVHAAKINPELRQAYLLALLALALSMTGLVLFFHTSTLYFLTIIFFGAGTMIAVKSVLKMIKGIKEETKPEGTQMHTFIKQGVILLVSAIALSLLSLALGLWGGWLLFAPAYLLLIFSMFVSLLSIIMFNAGRKSIKNSELDNSGRFLGGFLLILAWINLIIIQPIILATIALS